MTTTDASERYAQILGRAREQTGRQARLAASVVAVCLAALWLTGFFDLERFIEGAPAVAQLASEMVPPNFSRWQSWIKPLLDTLAMPGMRDATFGDLIHEVRLRVAARGHAAQTPSAEGALTAAIGSRTRTSVLYDIEHTGTTTTLQAGVTAGITRGSRFALYANQADAVMRRARVATASVTNVAAATAVLVLGHRRR